MPEKEDDMSEANKRVAELIAQTVIARLIETAQDRETASKIMGVWGEEVDRTIGKGLRRALWYLFLAFAGLAAMKFGLVEKVLSLLKP